MFVYAISQECADNFYGPEFVDKIFSTREKAQSWIDKQDTTYLYYINEVEIDEQE